MRILLLTNKSPWPPKDGGAAATLGMIEGLKACGAILTLIALNPGKHYISPDYIKETQLTGISFRLIPADTSIKPLQLLSNLLFSKHPYTLERFESEELRSILCSLPDDSFDIVQAEGLAMTTYLDTLKRFKNARIIFRPHNVENRIWAQMSVSDKNPFRKYYFRILASRTAKFELNMAGRFDGLVTMTQNDLDWFIAGGACSPATVCPSCFPDLKPGYTEGGEGRVFFIGALDWMPNIAGLKWFRETVWPDIVRNRPEATFHIAGRNPSPDLKEIFRGRNVIFHGEVESSKEFISKSQVMIVPLFAGSGLRMKILEGMSLGKSIVSTPVGAEGTTVTNDKDIFIRSGSREFAETILWLLDNPAVRKETGINAVENVSKKYNILASSENLMKFYSLLI